MDIRRFFSPTNASKKGLPEKFTNITSKEDAKRKDRAQPNSKKRRLVVIDSDSDEEPIPSKKTHKGASQSTENAKKNTLENNISPPKNKLNFGALKKHKPEAKALKPVIADDFFNSPPKKTTTKMVQPKNDVEYDIVDDDDFEQTLDQLDKKSKPNPNKAINGDISSIKLKSKGKQMHNLSTKVQTFEGGEKLESTDDPTATDMDNLRSKVDKGDKVSSMKKAEKSTNKLDKMVKSTKKPDKLEKTKTPEKVEKSTKTEKVEKSTKTSGKVEKTKTPEKVQKPTKTPEKVQNSTKTSANEKVKVEKDCVPNNSEDLQVDDTDSASSIHDQSTKVNKKAEDLPGQNQVKIEGVSSPKAASTPETKRNSFNYHNYLHREGPQALGSKEIPEGEESCLQGLTFIITGVLESLERDEAKDLIVKYGGKVMSNISKTTQYMVIGRDAGPAKLEKAEKFGTKLVNEDELLYLIKTMPGKKNSPKSLKKLNETKNKSTLNKIKVEEAPIKDSKTAANDLVPSKTTEEISNLMWVDKYKPTSLKQVIGQQGDRSCANKLLYWLRNWWRNNTTDKAQKKWNAKEDGSIFKSALLSGPPGVGKTTTAQLACRELGYEFIELNASDTRSKKSLQTEISELLQNKTLSASLKGDQLIQKHVIIFDEVDGMSGNEDRGGTQELISLIRHSKIPVICICNDRQHPKIRSLANYCFDLRFLRPRVEQIKGAMMSLLHKEKMKVPPETLQEIITATNQDLRQVLHHLSFLSSKDMNDSKNLKPSTKDVKLGPFEVLKKVFATEEAKASVNEKASLFFHDYSLAPLFVQENYAAVKPIAAKSDVHKHLNLLSQAAESISYSDTIDRCIRSQNNWSLLPTQAIFASVIPGECMRGYMSQMILFPQWLGKNSSRNHMDRVLQQIHMHTRLRVSGNKTELALDYLQHIRHNLTTPLMQYGSEMVPQVLDVMENYFLLREDLDTVVELTQWPGQKDVMASIEPKTKAALTRALNKEGHKNPYATVSVKKGKKRSVDTSFDGEEDGIEESEDDDDSKMDAMVKVKKASGAKVSKQETEIAGPSSKGKGRGKSSTSGRGRGRGRK